MQLFYGGILIRTQEQVPRQAVMSPSLAMLKPAWPPGSRRPCPPQPSRGFRLDTFSFATPHPRPRRRTGRVRRLQPVQQGSQRRSQNALPPEPKAVPLNLQQSSSTEVRTQTFPAQLGRSQQVSHLPCRHPEPQLLYRKK